MNLEGGGMWGMTYRTYAIADQQYYLSRCISHGFGDWEGIAEEPFFEPGEFATGYRFECEANQTNAFQSPGGIAVPVVHDWVVADGVIVAAIEGGDFEEADAFNQDFRNWLLANHNDVFRRMGVMPWLYPDEDSIVEALEYVDLFVADSPDWPRQRTN
jgi:hypothetical protein